MLDILEDWFTFQLLPLAEVWPAHNAYDIISRKMPGGHFTIRGEHNGKITFRFSDKEGNLIAEVKTPKIRKVGIGLARMGVIVAFKAASKSLEVHIDGRELHQMERRYDVAVQPIPDGPKTEDKLGIKAAVSLRTQQARSRIKSGMTSEQIKVRWSDLEREARLLRAAIDNLRSGDDDHVVSASVHLRKIIGDGLLEECAGFAAAELPVFVLPPIPNGAWTPDHMQNVEENLRFQTMSARPGYDFTHKIDLATWRDQVEGSFQGKPHTNKQFLLLIADKIGAHADRKRALVDSLESTEFSDIKALSLYLYYLGESIVTLINDLVALKNRDDCTAV